MKNESEWTYLPLSEERIVAHQLKNRSHLDAAYRARQQNGTTLESQGGFGMAEAVQCTYIDLDRLIAACDLPAGMLETLRLVMDGYSLRDISETQYRDPDAVERDFRNAVSRIVRQNNQDWNKTYARKFAGSEK